MIIDEPDDIRSVMLSRRSVQGRDRRWLPKRIAAHYIMDVCVKADLLLIFSTFSIDLLQ